MKLEIQMAKKPKVTFSKHIDAAVRHRIFRALQEATQINVEGQISWGIGGEVDQHISVLRDAFEFPEELSSKECAKAVWRGLLDARKKGDLTDSSVMEELQRLADTVLAQKLRRYSMWSRVSYKPLINSREEKFNYDDVSIKLASHLPTYMLLSSDQMSDLRPIPVKDKPNFGYIVAATTARNETHAADKIFRSTEIFQAVYNLVLKTWNLIGSEQKPEALMLMGPYHFLFREKKSLHTETLWYNPAFRDEHWGSSSGDSKKIYETAQTVRDALAKLENHPLKEPISSALLMMNDGMQSADMSRRTLRYWTAIERLFQADNERVSYENIIKRATYLEDAESLAKAKLARLVRIRNRYVHMGATENEHHQLTQYLADHVRRHLFYILFNGDDFTDHSEFLEMTKLPSDAETLKRQRNAIDRRERMIEKGRHRND
jgi:hypothetical protein